MFYVHVPLLSCRFCVCGWASLMSSFCSTIKLWFTRVDNKKNTRRSSSSHRVLLWWDIISCGYESCSSTRVLGWRDSFIQTRKGILVVTLRDLQRDLTSIPRGGWRSVTVLTECRERKTSVKVLLRLYSVSIQVLFRNQPVGKVFRYSSLIWKNWIGSGVKRNNLLVNFLRETDQQLSDIVERSICTQWQITGSERKEKENPY